MLIAGGLAVSGLWAAEPSPIVVTLPHAVTIGNTVLPSGEYTISPIDVANGDEYFVVRSAHSSPVTLQAQKVPVSDESLATQLVFTREGDTWHFDKMIVEGQGSGYQFVNVK